MDASAHVPWDRQSPIGLDSSHSASVSSSKHAQGGVPGRLLPSRPIAWPQRTARGHRAPRRGRVRGGTGILPVRFRGIGVPPMLHGRDAHATKKRPLTHPLRRREEAVQGGIAALGPAARSVAADHPSGRGVPSVHGRRDPRPPIGGRSQLFRKDDSERAPPSNQGRSLPLMAGRRSSRP